ILWCYISGCDGAHSTVRHILGIPFVGAAYEQEFILADVTVNQKIPKDNLTVFMNKTGILLHIPLRTNLSRLIIFDMKSINTFDKPSLTLEEIQQLSQSITGGDFQLSNLIWVSRFHLHHRAVQTYQKGRAFLAGDAAHIHSPIGAQGMNTGLQDATNLAWKIALILKYQAPQELLETYQTERQRIGEILVNTTDRLFGAVITKNYFITILRLYVMPYIMRFLVRSVCFRRRIFGFISQLNIHYHDNPFIFEKIDGADSKFLSGPQAGRRAPDAPIQNTTLFKRLREKPFNILLFYPRNQALHQLQENKILKLEKILTPMIGIHRFTEPKDHKLLYERYGITDYGSYFIRPDGYIGFRSFGSELDSLKNYLHKLFGVKSPLSIS
ncbi:MAG: FAD-dependent monooxygenase, partial [Alphaproteobacteria bacterium]|nr:FAD-dependent monooxygenase [Alphaproteobacteria bacterium]